MYLVIHSSFFVLTLALTLESVQSMLLKRESKGQSSHHGSYSLTISGDEKTSTGREDYKHLAEVLMYLDAMTRFQEDTQEFPLSLRSLEPPLYPTAMIKYFQEREDPPKKRQKKLEEDGLLISYQQSLKDSALSYFFNNCLVPSFISLNDDVTLRNEFGVRNPVLEKLSKFLTSVLGSAKNKGSGDFDLDTLKTIFSSLISALLSSPGNTPGNRLAQTSSQSFHILPKIINHVIDYLGPLDFSKHFLQLVSAYFIDKSSIDVTALQETAKFFTNYFSRLIDSTDLDKQYKEVIKEALEELIPLALKRVLSKGGELTTEEKMRALGAILKVIRKSFNLPTDNDPCSSLFETESKPSSKNEKTTTDYKQTFDCIFRVALKNYPMKGVLLPLHFTAPQCEDAVKVLVRVIPEHLTELLGNGPEQMQ